MIGAYTRFCQIIYQHQEFCFFMMFSVYSAFKQISSISHMLKFLVFECFGILGAFAFSVFLFFHPLGDVIALKKQEFPKSVCDMTHTHVTHLFT